MKKFHKQTNDNEERSSCRFSQHKGKHQTQILTDIKGSFQSLDIGCNPRDTVDAHLLHPTSLYLLHTLAHYVSLPLGPGNLRIPKQPHAT
uniref:Uncharacterized protein n=1 Tax=Anas zonorhyncha TaxID=75864 RepID=A0A8B9W4J0_9AVES